jgi:hypothetical protein
MGNWSMHIEGHGIHDNGKDEDADVMLREFTGKLASAGHQVHSATITIGAARELVNGDDTTPLRAGEHDYRPIL